MPINTRQSYIEIASDFNESTNELAGEIIQLPAPISLQPMAEFEAEATRNAQRTMIMRVVGRTQQINQYEWSRLQAELWWKLNRFFDTYDYVFYMKYLCHTDGKIKIHRFYRGNVSGGTPSTTTKIKQGEVVPEYYIKPAINCIDMGENNVYIVKTLEV